MGLFSTTKSYQTLIMNVNDLFTWADSNTYASYAAYKNILAVIGERDHILQRGAMIDSAGQASNIDIIQTRKTNHFVSLEQPDTIRALINAI